jgi:GNAT superfamily N-acetyltransferase
MNPAARSCPAGIVFRRVQTSPEREAAVGLLVDSGVPVPTVHGPGTLLFGLWDLAAADPEVLVGVVATRSLDAAAAVELCGLAVRAGQRGRGLGRRLLAEVADTLRAAGAARLITRPAPAHSPAAALLARAGFAATGGTDAGWLYLEL